MSELIHNREYRKQALKDVIRQLHEGKTVQEVKAKFDALIENLDASELSRIEQEMIQEGLPITEVQRMCDVHAAVFKDALENAPQPDTTPGHPVHTFMMENRAIEQVIDEARRILKSNKHQAVELLAKLQQLAQVDKHYSRKENLLFPYLEKYEITGPPKVMWGVDDELRADLKRIIGALAGAASISPEMATVVEKLLSQLSEMVVKEEKILLPMALDTLSEDEWVQIAEDSGEFGYCLYQPENVWHPERVDVRGQAPKIASASTPGDIEFPTGVLSPTQISLIFNHLPLDITFVDQNDAVRYFSNGLERIFPRTRTIIGRKVENCHPPASVHIVEQIVSDFKSGAKDHEDFWLHVAGKYVLIRYFAIRDQQGMYMGTLEVSQDIGPLQKIQGEKRISD